MKKLFGMVCALSLLAGNAFAAPTEVNLTQNAAGSDQWDLTLKITDPVQIGAVALLIDGATNFAFNTALTGGGVISISDSVNAQSGTARHVVANPPNFGQVMFAGPSAIDPLIGTFTIPVGVLPVFLSSQPDGGILQTPDFVELPSTTHVHPIPEPASAVLLGFGLASLALVRRKA